jgi:ACS family tartrate transporter-like MFS transporter
MPYAPNASCMDDFGRQTARKVWWRIVPLMTAAFFFSYLDRVNIGFAAVTMNRALGFSNTVFGVGAGAFAIGYALFGVPSTLLLHRVGARRWISVMMIAWAVCSAATAFVTNFTELSGARLLLGIAEAGFTPGVIFYFGYWFPSEYRGRALSSFYFIGPLGLLIGGPLSSAVLSLDGFLGFAGWRWLFIVEAFPTLLLAVLVFWAMPDNPVDASWLSPTEKRRLGERLMGERRDVEGLLGEVSVWRTLMSTRVWVLAAVYLGVGTSGIGAVFFLPLMIRSMGFSILSTGFVAAAPGLAAALALPLWGIWTDRSRRRESVVAAACCAMSIGLLGTAVLLPSPWALASISIAMIGFYGCLAAFWTLPSAFLTGASAAAGIAFVNVVGNLGNFSGPAVLGAVSDLTRSYGAGLICLAVIAACAGATMIAQAIRPRGAIRRPTAQSAAG